MRKYIGLFLIAFAMLALEVALTRLLSVITWYFLSFFAIATGMLGATAGATTVYLQPNWFTKDRLERSVANACLGFALAIPVTLFILTRLSLPPVISVQNFLNLLLMTFACALPFYFAGVASTVMLTKIDLPIGKLYASDLAGAALGSLFVLGGLEAFDAPSLILLISAVASAAWLVLKSGSKGARTARWHVAVPLGITALAIFNAVSGYGIRPTSYKGVSFSRNELWLEKWNSYSHVMVFNKTEGPVRLWGPSPLVPANTTTTYHMQIDGEADTIVHKFHSLEDIELLRYDVTSTAYYLRPSSSSLIIGVGGGRDLQTAILFGNEHVVGVDVNPIFINLMTDEFAEFAGLSAHPAVELYVAEGRGFVSQSTERYDIIQMSLIDTWAATGAGAFSLSENALYTVEAWDTFYQHLDRNGIFTVSRWYNPDNLGETGRIVSLSTATLLRNGVEDPSNHIALLTSGQISTLLFSRDPFTEEDVRILRETSSELQFETRILPGVEPEDEVLRQLVAARSMSELKAAVADEPLNLTPPTDETPYFFNMLRLNHVSFALQQHEGIIKGNLVATLTLILSIITLLLVALLTIIVPLRFKVGGQAHISPPRPLWAAALYFSLIGAGFMLVEIALIQRLSVFLSHPIYALGVLLFTIIASTGLGSYISERLPLTRPPWLFLYPVLTAAMILLLRVVLGIVLARMITYPVSVKIVIAVVAIFPIGILLGLFFPTGMRLVRSMRTEETPWYWALNGIFSVLCSALAVLISIYLGVSTNFYIAAGCYLSLVLCLWRIQVSARNAVVPEHVVGSTLPAQTS